MGWIKNLFSKKVPDMPIPLTIVVITYSEDKFFTDLHIDETPDINIDKSNTKITSSLIAQSTRMI